MDAQGRLLIPQLLREMATLAGEVAVLGLQTYLAVVNDAKQRASLVENPLTDADMDALGSGWFVRFAPEWGNMRADTMAEPQHIPVLLEESLNYLNVRPGGVDRRLHAGLRRPLGCDCAPALGPAGQADRLRPR